MSMSVSSATASTWNSYAAYSRVQSARAKLRDDLSPMTASNATITSDRAAVVNAEHEYARIEAIRAADMARLQASGHTLDLLV